MFTLTRKYQTSPTVSVIGKTSPKFKTLSVDIAFDSEAQCYWVDFGERQTEYPWPQFDKPGKRKAELDFQGNLKLATSFFHQGQWRDGFLLSQAEHAEIIALQPETIIPA